MAEPRILRPNGSSQAAQRIRLAVRTMAGAYISEAAAPITTLLRVIGLSWIEIGAVNRTLL